MRKGLWTVQLRNFRNTHPAGVLFYTQEGYDCVEEAFPLRVSLLPVDVEITGQYGGRSSVGLERYTVDVEVVGSNPTCHPKRNVQNFV